MPANGGLEKNLTVSLELQPVHWIETHRLKFPSYQKRSPKFNNFLRILAGQRPVLNRF
jgi:hypothetical protein